MNLVGKAKNLISDFKLHWKTPAEGRYMPFKEIAAYAGGGIGAYFIITLGTTLIVSTTNMIVGGAIGVAPTDMYLLYIIATIANIPLTAVRANMIDNTRGKHGKYRPYLLNMGIPTALIAIAYVWFPYDMLDAKFGESTGYILTCAVVLLWNLLLQFFFNFFNDAYTNLIHVLSPNTQERTDVLAIKSVVYSLAPSIVNIALPIVAEKVANNNLYDIRVYRVSYPVFAIIGIALTIVVYANTKEKIVQAKTHTIQVRFIDSFKAVAKNKYFWIIALAGWLGFLESAYGSVIDWSYNYGHVCSGSTISIIRTIISNASLWGMILAPICVRRFGKKKVLIGVNMMNIVCILAMMVNIKNIIWLAFCIYLNWFFGAFEQITTPAIQADIRDYHQYKTGERVDGMFATVQTIGNIVTLATSSVLPLVYKHYGIFEGNGYKNSYDILDTETGDPGLLYKVLPALIIMAAVGAFLNVVPYFFYDLNEIKQKSVIRILKIRAALEDYKNGEPQEEKMNEAADIIVKSHEMLGASPKTLSRSSYKKVKDKEERKLAKAQFKADREYNEEIEIAKIVCEELHKYSTDEYIAKIEVSRKTVEAGLKGIINGNLDEINTDLAQAKAMPVGNAMEKQLRRAAVETAQSKKSAVKAYKKYFDGKADFAEPDFAVLESFFDAEDECDEKLNKLYEQKRSTAKGDKALAQDIENEIKRVKADKKAAQKNSKAEMDRHAFFARAAKPYLDAKKLLDQMENYSHLDEITAKYATVNNAETA